MTTNYKHTIEQELLIELISKIDKQNNAIDIILNDK